MNDAPALLMADVGIALQIDHSPRFVCSPDAILLDHLQHALIQTLEVGHQR